MTAYQHPKLSVYNLPWPTNWAAVFRRSAPLIVEIGFGNGNYLIELARQHPDCNVIGLEIASRSLEKAERKLGLNGVHNARAVFSKAEAALAHLFEPRSVREFHINYPDPWFKKRHSGRRLIQPDTATYLASRLEVGGRLYLATDIRDYAEMADEVLSNTPALQNCLPTPWTHSFPRLTTTKYEAKGFAEGRPGHYFLYQRTADPFPEPPALQELSMPHVVIHTPVPAPEIVAAHREQQFNPAEGVHIKIRDAFLHQNGRAVMFEAEVIDPTVEQHVAIMLYPREEPQTFTVKYTTLGQPRMTPGLHYATGLLAKWVVSLHPDGRILSSKIAADVG